MLEPWAEVSERLRRNFKLMHYSCSGVVDKACSHLFGTVEHLRQAIACSGSKVFRRKSTVLRYSSGSTDNVGYILKQIGTQGYGSSRRLR